MGRRSWAGLACVSLTFYLFGLVGALKFKDEKALHTAKALSQDDITFLASLTNETYFDDVLRHILVPRVVGTPSHDNVKQFIINELTDLGWSIEVDDFRDWTPNLGRKEFSNVIARLNPNAKRHLVLACHYDSKYFPGNKPFLGATDSAVPCAMMIHLAKVLSQPLDFARTSDISLMLIFFDGEEAFEEWTDYDSIYGARNLAKIWSKAENTGITHLDRMDMLVLLDLLGAKDPQFYSYFGDTARWHSFLSKTERNMKVWGLIPPNQPLHFLEKSTFSFIEDDHVPFLKRGVPILHVIPHPFPKVWHKMSDNYSALDFPTITTLNKLLQVFVMSYLSGGTNTY